MLIECVKFLKAARMELGEKLSSYLLGRIGVIRVGASMAIK